MTKVCLLTLSAAALAFFGACSSDGGSSDLDAGGLPDGSSTWDSGSQSDGSTLPGKPVTDAGADAQPRECNAPLNSAPTITRVRVAATLPSGTSGGTIQSGTYYLTKQENYTGIGGASGPRDDRKETLVVDGAQMRWVDQVSDQPGAALGPERAGAGAFSTNGAMLTVNVSCPADAGTKTILETFDVVGDELVRHATGSLTYVRTYKRQP